MNTNIFSLKILPEDEYEYCLVFQKAPNNSVFEYIWSKLFKYIRSPQCITYNQFWLTDSAS